MGVSIGFLKFILILAWGRQVHTPVLACMLPYTCMQQAHVDVGDSRLTSSPTSHLHSFLEVH